MPLPPSWTLIPVTATYLKGDGSPARGTVVFSSPQIVVIDDVTIVPRAIQVPLNANGELFVELPATTDTSINPVGWAYKVTERIPGLGRSLFWLTVDAVADAGGFDLSSRAPLLLNEANEPVVTTFRQIGATVPDTDGWKVNDLWLDTSTET